MLRRFFHRDLPVEGEFELADSEAHHLFHVLRARPGDRFEVFDGAGHCAEAEVTELSKRGASLRVLVYETRSLELSFELTIASAIPKGDRAQVMIEKLTELGCSRLVPLACERAQWKPSSKQAQKWHRWVVEASKQCGRNRLMTIESPMDVASWVEDSQGLDVRWVAAPGGASQAVAREGVKRVGVAIGPEGGWEPTELEMFERGGWTSVSLGPRILRIETAAIAMAGILGARSVGLD